MTKSPADETWWPGEAVEVEGGVPVVSAPTETEGIAFDGVGVD